MEGDRAMRILWTVNLLPREAALAMGESAEVLGGWVEAMTKQLRERQDIQLAIACKVKDGMAFQKEIHQVTYYSLSYSEKKQEASLRAQCKQIIEAYHLSAVAHIDRHTVHLRCPAWIPQLGFPFVFLPPT